MYTHVPDFTCITSVTALKHFYNGTGIYLKSEFQVSCYHLLWGGVRKCGPTREKMKFRSNHIHSGQSQSWLSKVHFRSMSGHSNAVNISTINIFWHLDIILKYCDWFIETGWIFTENSEYSSLFVIYILTQTDIDST